MLKSDNEKSPIMKPSDAIKKLGDNFLNPVSLSLTSAHDRPIVYVNKHFCELTKYNESDIVGRNCRFLQGPKTDNTSVLRIKEAINQKLPICQDLLNYKVNGEIFYNRLLLVPFKESSHEFFVGLQHEINLEQYKPFNNIDKSVLLDRTMNPIAILVGLLTQPDLDFQADLMSTMLRIKNYILSL